MIIITYFYTRFITYPPYLPIPRFITYPLLTPLTYPYLGLLLTSNLANIYLYFDPL